MFSRCRSVHRGRGMSAPLHAGIHSPRQTPPLDKHPHWANTLTGQTPPLGKHPHWVDTPGQKPPWADTHLACNPWADPPPPLCTAQTHLGTYPLPSACWDTPPAVHAGIWSTSGRYASHLNAFLLTFLWATVPFRRHWCSVLGFQ